MIDDILAQIVDGVRRAIDDGHYRTGTAAPGRRAERPSLRAAIEAAAPEALLAEVKPASPSAGGLIGSDALTTGRHLVSLFQQYGATGVSVLTERDRFGGSIELLEAATRSPLPVLMKDFIVADEQLDAAAAAGASAVLFIHHLFARGQTTWELPEAIRAAHARGLQVLLEVDHHQALEHALTTDADILGVNNRDLRTLELDLGRTSDLLRFRLQRLAGRPVLALSGIRQRDDVVQMRRSGASGVLVGTSIMEAADPRAQLRGLRGLAHVKICGAGHPEDGAPVAAALAGADAVGCVVAAGGAARERTVDEARRLFSALPPDQEHVLVTTDTDIDACVDRVAETGANAIQVHAEAGDTHMRRLREQLPKGIRLIAVVRVPEHLPTPDDPAETPSEIADLVADARTIGQHATRLLLDVAPRRGESAGGTGRRLDRDLARHLVAALRPLPVVLAGGLGPGEIAATLRAVRPYGIDVSSGAEAAVRGRKDPDRIRSILAEARSVTGLFDPFETGPAFGPPLIRDVQWRDPTYPSTP